MSGYSSSRKRWNDFFDATATLLLVSNKSNIAQVGFDGHVRPVTTRLRGMMA